MPLLACPGLSRSAGPPFGQTARNRTKNKSCIQRTNPKRKRGTGRTAFLAQHSLPHLRFGLVSVRCASPARKDSRLAFPADYDTKQRIKQAVDIVNLVQSYLPLRHEGQGYKALCPWHADTRPSLQVNPARQSYRCWVCDIGGDIFSFVMKIEGVDFPAVLAMLADRANIRLQPTGRSGPAGDDKRLLYQAMAWASGQYHQFLLNDPAAAVARDYIGQRGITPDSLRRFQLGFAPDEWTWLTARRAAVNIRPRCSNASG